MPSQFFTDPPHPIRLRGPWEFVVVKSATGSPAGTTGRVRMPDDWASTLGDDFRGTVCYERFFHAPSGLTDLVHVLIVVDAVDYSATLRLNGQPLGTMVLPDGPCAFEVTDKLLPRNQLEIEVTLPIDLDTAAEHNRALQRRSAGGLIGEVRLEIGHELAKRQADDS